MHKNYSRLTIYFKILFAVLLIVGNIGCQQKKEVKIIPLKDFFRNPEKTQFSISPDGNYISFLQPYENRMNVHVQNLKTGKVTRLTSEKKQDILFQTWINDRLVYGNDNNGDQNYHAYSVNIDGTGVKDLTPFDKVTIDLIDFRPHDNPDEILLGLNKRNPMLFDAYRLNIKTGVLKLVALNPGNIRHWEVDNKGKIRLAVASDGVNSSLLYRETEDQPFKTILTTSFMESLNPIRFCEEGDCIYASSNIGRDKSAIVKFNLVSAKETEVIYENDKVDANWLQYSRKNNKPLFVYYADWKTELHFLDDETKQLYKDISSQLPDDIELRFAGNDDNEEKLLLRTFSDKTLGAYYLYEKLTKKLTKLSDISPWLHAEDMAEMKPIEYKTRDGLTIHGYLTLPVGLESKNLPVIIIPHSNGTNGRTRWGFDDEAQFFANRGYAVFHINYRGTRGYGRLFREAGFKQWGKNIQNDITDGVKWLINQQIADSTRIGIYGYNYGGLIALNGLIQTPHLYKCGVSYSGISNFFTYIKDIPPYFKPQLNMTYKIIGNPETDADYLREVSPVFHTDKIKAPLLIAQGATDPWVNVNETDQLVKELMKNGVDVTYIMKEEEGRSFRKEENRLELYTEMERFFEKNLK